MNDLLFALFPISDSLFLSFGLGYQNLVTGLIGLLLLGSYFELFEFLDKGLGKDMFRLLIIEGFISFRDSDITSLLGDEDDFLEDLVQLFGDILFFFLLTIGDFCFALGYLVFLSLMSKEASTLNYFGGLFYYK